METTTPVNREERPKPVNPDHTQLPLFELPTKTCLSCHRVIRIDEEATHPCFYLD